MRINAAEKNRYTYKDILPYYAQQLNIIKNSLAGYFFTNEKIESGVLIVCGVVGGIKIARKNAKVFAEARGILRSFYAHSKQRRQGVELGAISVNILRNPSSERNATLSAPI